MNRTAATTILSVAMLVAMTGAACGSGDDAQSASSPAPGRTQPPAAETRQPQSTATPAATETPVPSPTPPRLELHTAERGSGTNTPPHLGPLGIKYAEGAIGYDAGRNHLEVGASIFAGSSERPSASAWLTNTFFVPGEGTTPVTAQVSSGVRWQGVLAGNGAGGTRAAVTITMSILDGDRVVASEVVHALEQRESVLTLGGFDDIGRQDVDLSAALIPGRSYELRLTASCEASSGLVGVATHCVFITNDLYDDGLVEWEPRTILFVP